MKKTLLLTTLALAVCGSSQAATTLISNGDFEASPFDTSWTNGAATAETTAPLEGSTSARMNGTGNLSQSFSSTASDFIVNVDFQQLGNTSGRSFNMLIGADGARPTLNMRVQVESSTDANSKTVDDVLQMYNGNGWETISTDGFFSSTTESYSIQVVGRNWGTANAEYDVSWSEAGSTDLTNSANGLSFFQNSARAEANEADAVVFVRSNSNYETYIVDNVSVVAVPEPSSTALLGLAGLGLILRRRR